MYVFTNAFTHSHHCFPTAKIRIFSKLTKQNPPTVENFREDNSSLTLGRDGRYYFVFTLPEKQLAQLPDRLVHQALTIAQKVDKMIAGRVGKKGSKK